MLVALALVVGVALGAVLTRAVIPLIVLTSRATRPVPEVLVQLPFARVALLLAGLVVAPLVVTGVLVLRRGDAASSLRSLRVLHEQGVSEVGRRWTFTRRENEGDRRRIFARRKNEMGRRRIFARRDAERPVAPWIRTRLRAAPDAAVALALLVTATVCLAASFPRAVDRYEDAGLRRAVADATAPRTSVMVSAPPPALGATQGNASRPCVRPPCATGTPASWTWPSARWSPTPGSPRTASAPRNPSKRRRSGCRGRPGCPRR